MSFHKSLPFGLLASARFAIKSTSSAINPSVCSKLINRSVVSYNELIKCYNSFVFDKNGFERYLETLKLASNYNIYKEVAEAPRDSEIESFDFDYQIENLKTQHYDYSWQAHQAISQMYLKFGTLDTFYYHDCFTQYDFIQPIAIYTDQFDKFKIVPNLKYNFNEWNHLNFVQLGNAEIIKINKMDTRKFLSKYSKKHVGSTMDDYSRITLSLARIVQNNGKWGWTLGEFTKTRLVPSTSHLNFTIKINNKLHEIQVPYLAKKKTTTLSHFCHVKPRDHHIEMKPTISFITDGPAMQFKKQIWELPVTKFSHSTTYRIIGSGVGIIKLNQFPSNLVKWTKEIQYQLFELHRKGIHKLIVDVGDTQGGSICHAYTLFEILAENPFERRFLSDFKLPHLPLKNYSQFHHPNGTIVTEKDLKIKYQYHRGRNFYAEFTAPIIEQCPSINRELIYFKWDRHIALLTNTICFHACSILVASLKEQDHTRLYTANPLSTDTPPRAYSNPNFKTVSLSELGWKLPQISHKFPYHEVYSSRHAKLRPLAYTWQTGRHLNISYTHPVVNWYHIASLMNSLYKY